MRINKANNRDNIILNVLKSHLENYLWSHVFYASNNNGIAIKNKNYD